MNSGTIDGIINGIDTNTIQAARIDAQVQGAQERRARFPYRFPTDRRKAGGSFTVDENAEHLLRFFYLERRLSQALGSWTLAIPEFEVMLETGRHIFYHMDAAKRLRDRLFEQEKRANIVDFYRDPSIDTFIDEALSASNAPELLVGIHQVAGRALQKAYRHHIDNTCPVADAPTIRVLTQILSDYDVMLDWSDAAIEAYIAGGVDAHPLEQWRWHLSKLLASIGGPTGASPCCAAPKPLKSDESPYERGTVPLRDVRFATFSNTGDYNIADGEARSEHGSYEDRRLHFVRTQRDEVDAIEAFGTFLWDIRFKDFDAEYQLARITWDECRHTELGHRMLMTMGYDPYELPNRITSSTCRGPMEPEFAMAEINLFGEVGILRTIGDLIGEAQDRNDSILVYNADFIRSDERTHVRKGQHILKIMTNMGMQDLELRTRELFTECLMSLGAINTDLGTLSREEIIRLVGE